MLIMTSAMNFLTNCETSGENSESLKMHICSSEKSNSNKHLNGKDKCWCVKLEYLLANITVANPWLKSHFHLAPA